MGRITADNIVTNIDGQTYNPSLPCDQNTSSNCLARIRGEGGMYGVLFGLTATKRFGDFDIEGAVGKYLYRSWWHADIINLQYCGQGCNIPLRSPDGGSERNTTNYYGITLRYKFLYLSDKEFQNITQPMGLTSGKVRTVSFGVSYQF